LRVMAKPANICISLFLASAMAVNSVSAEICRSFDSSSPANQQYKNLFSDQALIEPILIAAHRATDQESIQCRIFRSIANAVRRFYHLPDLFWSSTADHSDTRETNLGARRRIREFGGMEQPDCRFAHRGRISNSKQIAVLKQSAIPEGRFSQKHTFSALFRPFRALRSGF
jgi:hypothetical protein